MCEAWEVYPILRRCPVPGTEKNRPGFFGSPRIPGDRGTAGSGGADRVTGSWGRAGVERRNSGPSGQPLRGGWGAMAPAAPPQLLDLAELDVAELDPPGVVPRRRRSAKPITPGPTNFSGAWVGVVGDEFAVEVYDHVAALRPDAQGVHSLGLRTSSFSSPWPASGR